MRYYAPGSVLMAKTVGIAPDHRGIAGYVGPDGVQEIVHSRPPWGVQVTTFAQFACGRRVETLWIPQNLQQQNLALTRAYSQIGRPWLALEANCEHFTSWVVTGVPHSPQLIGYVVGAGMLGTFLYALTSPSKRARN